MDGQTASIVVRCYNEREYIGRLLHGIEQQTWADVEVILVDSGSTDGTLDVAAEYDVDEIVYIDPDEFSFGRALNYGCEAASGEFCVFASAHVYPTRRDWLRRLLAPFDDENIALTYGKQRGNEVTTYSERQVFQQWFPEQSIHEQQSPFCNNANAAIRRDVWESIPYDEGLPGLEDIDWARRAQRAGYEISYVSEAEIIHVHDETAREVFNRYRREAIAHSQIINDQSFTFVDFLRTCVGNVVGDFRTAYADGVLLENLLAIPRFRFLQFWGTYRGFHESLPVSDRLWSRFYYPDAETLPDRSESVDRSGSDDDSSNDVRINYHHISD